jgi:signal transduction histidine kinase
MALSTFIREHHDEIIREFVVFAKTLMPPGAAMTDTELADHAAEMLTAVVQDMGLTQSLGEESDKAQGRGSAQTMELSATRHADDRILHGFTFRSVLAEFRALRATVLRLYENSGDSDLIEVRRFNEAIDEALTTSMDRFASETDRFRDQFVGVLSHDLRTPLEAISAGAAVLAMPEDNPQRRSRVVARIMSSAQRMARMIGDLLDVTRERLGGAMELKRRPADLAQVCDEVIMEIRAAQPEAVVRFQSSGNLIGEWDADRLAHGAG